MQGGGRRVHGKGKAGLTGCKYNAALAKVDGLLVDTREDTLGSLILEIWDEGYQQVNILIIILLRSSSDE